MRRALAALVVAAALVQAGTAVTATPDPGKRLAAALLSAASEHNAKHIWLLLSKPSQRRLGPTFAAFKRANAVRIERALEPFESPAVKLFIDRSLSDRFGLVAMRNGVRAIAFPLRREGKTWKIETPGPVQIAIIAPRPSSSGRVTQVAFEATGPGAIDDAIIFLDGKLYPPNLAPSGKKATVYVTLPKPLKRGVHIAVAYAFQGANVSALAWSFAAA